MEKAAVWLVAKIGGSDYAFMADMGDMSKIPDAFRVSKLTKILTSAQGQIQYGLWSCEKLGMIEGDTLMLKEALHTLSAASGALIDDLEKAWGMKTIITNEKKLVLPGT